MEETRSLRWESWYRPHGSVPLSLRLVCAALWPATLTYRATLALRRACYQSGLVSPKQVALPVLSVGNLTVGGTGKTPLARWIALWCQREGEKPILLSRGYGRLPSGFAAEDDEAEPAVAGLAEPAVAGLAEPAVAGLAGPIPRWTSADRVSSAERAWRQGVATVAILDDGFQYWRLRRDLDLVSIDATAPFGNGRLLPEGPLREPPQALSRADGIVITRADQVHAPSLDEILSRVSRLSDGKPVATACHRPLGYRLSRPPSYDEWLAPKELSGRAVVAFSGIGNPYAFRDSLERLGCRLQRFFIFRDHHLYTEREMRILEEATRQTKAECLLTTEKDFCRLPPGRPWDVPLGRLVVEFAWLSGSAEITELLRNALRTGRRQSLTKEAENRPMRNLHLRAAH